MNRKAVTANIRAPSLGLSPAAVVPVLFLIFVFLVGGGSRSDIASLPLLRGVAVLLAYWAAIGLSAEDWRRIRTPLVLLALLTMWIAIQLVPLPPEIWHGLPGRDTVAAIDLQLGQADIWRPMSLTPSQTWNSLLAMSVPIAALLLAARMNPEDYPLLLRAIVGVAVVSAVLGVFQIMSGSGSAAYLYRITNSNAMVGLFANRNHHAIFLACALVAAAALVRDERMRKRQNRPLQIGLLFAGLLMTAMTALIGSRAGFAVGVVAFGISYFMIIPTVHATPTGHRKSAAKLRASSVWHLLVYSPPVLLAMMFGTAIWLSDRTTALSRLAEGGFADDMRVQAWPTVLSMMETHWVLGSGFGSFPDVYKMIEPDALLAPSYFNHAHNDWAELVLTGGLPFVLIVVAAIIWFARKALALGLSNLVKGHRGDLRLVVLAVIAILAATSIGDYPFRVPSLQAMAVMMVILLCCPRSESIPRY